MRCSWNGDGGVETGLRASVVGGYGVGEGEGGVGVVRVGS